MAWKISFKNEKEQDCVIFIKNGKDDADTVGTNLTPAADPIQLQMDDDDDIFKPVRLSSGNIKVISSDTTLYQSIVANNPLDRPVKLTINGTVTWQGFVKCEVAEQTLFGYNEEVTIPIMSCLSALDGIFVDDTNWADCIWVEGTKIYTQKQLMSWAITRINTLLGSPYEITFPIGSPLSANYINKLNYVDEKDIEDIETVSSPKLYDGKSYMEILEDIMLFCGCCVIEEGSVLSFITPYCYYSSEIATNIDSFTYKSTDNIVSIVQGKKSVSVKANANVQSGTVISLEDIVKRLQFTSAVRGQALCDSSAFKDFYECRMEDGDGCFTSVDSNLLPGQVVIYDSTDESCAIEYEGTQTREGDDMLKNPKKFDFLKPAIVLRSGTQNASRVEVCIPFEREIPDAPKYKVSFSIETKTNKTGDWSSKTCKITIQNNIENGGAYLTKECKDGKFEETYSPTLDRFVFVAHCPDNSWKYARIKGFKIELVNNVEDSYGIDAFDNKETYESKKDIGKGFIDEYSIDVNLVSTRTSKSSIPGDTTTKKIYGRGVCPNIYTTDTAHNEESLCNNAYQYYGQSRMRLCIEIDSNTYLSANSIYTHNNTYYRIIAQSLNVRDCKLKLTLQECFCIT